MSGRLIGGLAGGGDGGAWGGGSSFFTCMSAKGWAGHISDEEEDKHATLNKLAIARMFKTTMAHGSAMDVLTALEDLNQKLKIAAGVNPS